MKSLVGLIGWLALSFAAAFFGSRFMPGEWYAGLTKPSWNPPDYLFGPVWSVLYAMIGVSAWLVWRKAGFSGSGLALGIFAIHLVFNALWSYLFFGLHRPDLALLDIVVLWFAIVLVAVLFWRVHRLAGAMMLPYLAWVTFASVLNYTLWSLNRPP